MRSLIITVYIGPLPALMPLWLRSAACNPHIDFLVVTNQSAPSGTPPNVRFSHTTLDGLRRVFSEYAGFEVCLATPYKLCDFKPMFWVLADDLAKYDFWGFCDLDVIFGDLAPLCDERLGRYDMVLSEGHLRFFRNSSTNREVWREVVHPRPVRDMLNDPAIFGIDEHPGINRVFEQPGRSWYANSALVADIDPAFRQFRLVAQFANHRHQAFYWDNGRVFREYLTNGKRRVQEFAYIHLQKRRLIVDPASADASAINIDPAGLVPRKAGDETHAAIIRRNPAYFPNRLEARIRLREAWRRMRGAPPQFVPVDRPDAAAG